MSRFSNLVSTPYEMENAREWDMSRNLIHTSSNTSEAGDFDDWGDDTDKQSSRGTHSNGGSLEVSTERSHDIQTMTKETTDNRNAEADGFQVVERFKKKSPAVQPNSLSQRLSRVNIPAAKQRLGSAPLSVPPRIEPVRRPKKLFNFRQDNHAKAEYRDRKPHNDIFRLPKRSGEIEPDRKKTYDLLEGIGVRFHSFILPPQTSDGQVLRIWGNEAQVTSTKVALQNWCNSAKISTSSAKSMKENNFAKINSTIGTQYRNEKENQKKKDTILKYQQKPDPEILFSYTGAYLWPVEEIGPQDLFGPNLEAWDGHRYIYKCHIVFDETSEMIRVYTNRYDSVQVTLDCIGGALKHYMVRNSRRIIEIILEPPTTIRQDIRLLPDPFGNHGSVPELSGGTIDHASSLTLSKGMVKSNNCRIERALDQTIYKLPYYHGLVRIRVNFGTYVLNEFRWPPGKTTIPLTEFSQKITQAGTKGILIRDLLFSKNARNILHQIWQKNELLVPADNSIDDLSQMAPVISARFEMNKPGKPATRLEVEMKSNSNQCNEFYEALNTSWTRLDNANKPAALEISMIRLEGGVSWKLEVSTENPIDAARIDPEMKQFSDSVKLKKGPISEIMISGMKMFQWQENTSSRIMPTAFEQKTALRYRLAQAQQWIFEIARYDCYGDDQKPNQPVTTNWCASICNEDWDSILTDNAGLTIGKAASWDPKLSTFFPRDDDAAADEEHAEVQGYQDIIKKITNCLDAMKASK